MRGPSGNEEQKKRGEKIELRLEGEGGGGERMRYLFKGAEVPFVGPRYERGNNAAWNVTRRPRIHVCVRARRSTCAPILMHAIAHRYG